MARRARPRRVINISRVGPEDTRNSFKYQMLNVRCVKPGILVLMRNSSLGTFNSYKIYYVNYGIRWLLIPTSFETKYSDDECAHDGILGRASALVKWHRAYPG